MNPECWDICTTCSDPTTLTDTRPGGKPIVQVLRSCCLGHIYTFDNRQVSPVRLCVMHRDGSYRLEHTGPQIYSAHLLLRDPDRLLCCHIEVSRSRLNQSRLILLDPSTSGILVKRNHYHDIICTELSHHLGPGTYMCRRSRILRVAKNDDDNNNNAGSS